MTGVDVRGANAGSVRPGCIVALSLVGLLRYGSTDWREHMEYRNDPDYLAEQAELREDEDAERQEAISELMDDGLTREQAEKVCCG